MAEMNAPAPTPPPRLEMRGITKRFGGTTALDGVDFDLRPGEVHALVGENGAGKSTLMKILSGAVPPDEGTILLEGEPYRPAGPLEARRAGVAMIYQELSLCPHLTVEENIILGMEPVSLGWIRRRTARAAASEALARLERADIPLDAPVGVLSPGLQQIVEIARALAVGCRVLVLDEPTSSLAEGDVERLFHVIQGLKTQGQAVVYISHFIEEVQRISDRYTVLRDGRVAGGGPTAGTSTAEVVHLMIGRRLDQMYTRTPRTPGEAVLEVEGLRGAAGPEHASFTLHRGEVLGIAGLVGAGRTELLRTLFGLEAVRSGRIRLASYAGPASPARRWRQGMGFLSEDRKNEGLAVSLNVADNLTLSRLEGLGPLGLVLPVRQARAAERWIEALDIRCRGPGQALWELSGGNQQKVALARLLHHDVDVFLLDEPTRGIDVASKAQIYKLIDRLATGGPGPAKAVLMVSSYLPELFGICDRIAVMCRGRLGKPRPVKACTEEQVMMEAVGGEEEP